MADPLTGEVQVILFPDPIIKSVIADQEMWRIFGERILERSRELCPVSREDDPSSTDYGKERGGRHLRDTLELRFTRGPDPRILIGSKLTVGAEDVNLLALVEEGTEPHDIYPVRARSLRFFMGGEVVFAQHVSHPGTKENRFVERAMQQVCLEANVTGMI